MTTWKDVRPGDRILGKDGKAWRVTGTGPGCMVILRRESDDQEHQGAPPPDAEVTILTRHHPDMTEDKAIELITNIIGGTVHDPCPHCNGTGVIQ